MSAKNTQARIKYWAAMTPEDKAKRMSSIAKMKQKKLTFKQRRDHALKMVAARLAKKKA